MRKKKKNNWPHCHWCNRQTTPPVGRGKTSISTSFTRDHVKPKSMGGRRTVVSCFACNNLKGNMTVDGWRQFMASNPKWWKLWRANQRHR